jgi:peptide/nickel transport system substrate-binding protein
VTERLLPFLFGVLALGVLSPGCQSGGDGGGDDGFVVVMDAKPDNLDPRFAISDASLDLLGLLHAGLLSYDTKDGQPELRLAESLEQTSPTTYEVTLRDDIYFHDGEPVTAEDVEYTYMELDSEQVQSPKAKMARRIDSFTVHDERNFTIELKKAYAPFKTNLSMGIVPKHICEGHAECPGEPIGAGPFTFESREGDHKFVLGANERYFGGTPKIDRLVFKVIEDANTRMLSLLGKRVDLVQNAVQPLMLPVVQEADHLELETGESFKYTYLAFNLDHPVLEHRKVRQALAYAIDRRAIIEHKFKGHATLSTGLLPPSHPMYEGDVRDYPYKPEKARKLLDEAGFPNPEGKEPRFRVDFKVSAQKFRKSIAQLIGHQLSRVGVDVRVRSYEWGTFFHDVKSGNFAMTSLQWVSVRPSMYRWIFHSENIPSEEKRSAGGNRGAYRNERVDELLDRAEKTTEQSERKRIFSEIQKVLARDLPYISLWHEHNMAILKRGVRGYYVTPNARFEGLKATSPAETSSRQSGEDSR